MPSIDQVSLNFNPQSLALLNGVLGLVMFGIALDFDLSDFKAALKKPAAFFIGLCCQFLLLPAIAFLAVKLLKTPASISLGLILVATCPGGNLSNLFTAVSRGNAALSVAMSTVSTMVSIVMTPVNLAFWGGMDPGCSKLLKEIHLDPMNIFLTVLSILVIPSLLGIFAKAKWPKRSQAISKRMNASSFVAFCLFAGVAFANNFEHFLNYVAQVFWPVLITNLFGIAAAFFVANGFRLDFQDSKAIGFEVGIQNAGFGLILIFNFFDGLGGMAVAAAWWGIWHVLSGGVLALVFWNRAKAAGDEQFALEEAR